MSEQLTCITCPLGCRLTVERGSAEPGGAATPVAVGAAAEPELTVTGNRCARGVRYAREELLAPKRVVSATAALAGGPGEAEARLGRLGSVSRVPVRTSAAFPKGEVALILEAIYSLRVALPVRRGDVLISDFGGSGIDVIATRTVVE